MHAEILSLKNEGFCVLICRGRRTMVGLAYLCRFCKLGAPVSSCWGAANLMGYALCRRPLTIAHCFKIVDSWHLWKRISGFCCLHFVKLSFGEPGASTLASWGTLGRSWDIYKKEQLEVQPWSFIDFLLGLGTFFWKLSGYLALGKVYFVMLVSTFLFLLTFGSNSGCAKASIWHKMYCKK